MTRLRIAGAFGLAVISTAIESQILSDELFGSTAAAIAQVSADECNGESRTGTGFLYGGSDLIVTSLHVITGCQRLSAYFEHTGNRTVRARLDRVLKRADLALLRLEESVAEPLETTVSAPVPNEELEVIAFFLSTPSLDNKALRVTYGSSRLRDMLPPQQRRDLDRNSTLDLNLSIVRLDGHLLPGASGAPLVNSEGKVAAIGNGGLNHGAASISWAVPAKHLDELLDSNEQEIPESFSNSLFAAASGERSDPTGGSLGQLRCGKIEFVVMGIRGFEQLSIATDDPLGLSQLVATADLPPRTLRNFEYWIYTPLSDGAAIAIPTWMSVQSVGTQCEARSPDGRLVVLFGGDRVRDPTMAQMAALAFEQEVQSRTRRNWWPDLNYTYATPLQRFDGLAATRKAWLTNDNSGPPAWGFETLMTKRSTFAGVFAMQYNHNPIRDLNCRYQNPSDPECVGIDREIANFFQTILGVHLSTFPIY